MQFSSRILTSAVLMTALLGVGANAANTYNTNPAGLAYNYSTGASVYGHPGGMLIVGSCDRDDPTFAAARASGAEILLYVDPVEVINGAMCPYEQSFYASSGTTTPLWPYPSPGARANYPNTVMADIRAGSLWSNAVVTYIENVMRSGKFDGVFLDVVGARLWTALADWSVWPQWEQDAWTSGNVDLVRRIDASRRAIRPSFIVMNNNVWDRGDTLGLPGEGYVDGVVLEHHPSTSAYHVAYADRTFSNLGHRRVLAIAKTAADALLWAQVKGVTDVSDQLTYQQVTAPPIPFMGFPTPAVTTTQTSTTTAAPSTFGITTVGTIPSAGLAANFKRGSRFALSQKGTLVNFSAYMDGLGAATGGQAVRVALYSDNGGVPGTLLLQSNTVGIPAGKTAGWVTFPTNTHLKLAPGNYWLLVHSGLTGGVARVYTSPVANWWGNADLYSDNASPTAGTGTVGTVTLSVNAGYTPGW